MVEDYSQAEKTNSNSTVRDLLLEVRQMLI
jgi:hypothetical protein